MKKKARKLMNGQKQKGMGECFGPSGQGGSGN